MGSNRVSVLTGYKIILISDLINQSGAVIVGLKSHTLQSQRQLGSPNLKSHQQNWILPEVTLNVRGLSQYTYEYV